MKVGDEVSILCNWCKNQVKAKILRKTIAMKKHWLAEGYCKTCRVDVKNTVKDEGKP